MDDATPAMPPPWKASFGCFGASGIDLRHVLDLRHGLSKYIGGRGSITLITRLRLFESANVVGSCDRGSASSYGAGAIQSCPIRPV